MVQTWPRLRFADRSAPGSSGESAWGRHFNTASSPILAGPSMVLGPDFSPRRPSLGNSSQEGSPLSGGGHDCSPPTGVMEAVGVAPDGAQLIASGFSNEIVETILHSRAPSTRKLYAWRRFTPSLGRHPLVSRFLRGVLRLRPPVRSRVPTWDLAVVLEAFCKPPFEPLEEISDRFLSLKTAFLLAISSLKRVGDLQALSVAPSYLDFAPGMAKAFLHPKPGYIPKVPSSVLRPVVLEAFCPPPFREPEQQKLNCMCPVRALDAYVHRAALWTDQLFVCFGPSNKGQPASKQTLSRWITDAISVAYESSEPPSPLGVKAHSTRGMVASKAFLSGAPLQDICNAAGWSTPLTFVRFYGLDLPATPGSSALSS
ncbi:40S ribosomal protein S0 [Labeo rohita]|uniref:40S ribosomal protein S0 n=1 Tax=Labeo rohita TaxID=84645 RepID=A0ABQ8LJW5_LABRO|nr:40S ribosomal protein S0 [Labeo rohita]